jgi:hypothetical protein
VDVSRRVSLADINSVHSRLNHLANSSQLGRCVFTVPLVSVSATPAATTNEAAAGGIRMQNISIPSDMVGCIIGSTGTKMTEIHRKSLNSHTGG